jgi:enoyl-CoA hydratase/carnithine racemase
LLYVALERQLGAIAPLRYSCSVAVLAGPALSIAGSGFEQAKKLTEAALESSGDRLVHVRLDQRKQGIIAHATINNARHLNAMNSALMEAFVDVMAQLATDERLRAVVLTGAGRKAFIVGADINEMAAIESAAQATVFITRLHRCCDAIRDLPVPVIARIQGFTFGAGLEIAAACDVRIAADAALFGMPEVKLGIPSVIEAALLPMLVGWGRAREIMLLGETFTANEALEWGLVERVVPAAALDEAIEAWIGRLLTSMPRAVRLQKRLIRQWEGLPLAAAIQAGIEAFARAYETDEPAVAMREFLATQKARKKTG